VSGSKVRSGSGFRPAGTTKAGTPTRSTGSARAEREAGAGRPPAPAPERGNLFRSRWFIAGVIAVVVVVTAGAIWLLNRDTSTPADPLSQEIAAMQQAEAERNEKNVGVIGEKIVAIQDNLLPVMSGLHGPLPTDESVPVPATAAAVAEWKKAIVTAHDDIMGLPSGNSEYNIARNGFGLAVKVLGSSVAAYEAALSATDADAPALLALAGDLRNQASEAWSVAAIELDLLYNAADKGHLHIALPVLPTGDDGPDTESGH